MKRAKVTMRPLSNNAPFRRKVKNRKLFTLGKKRPWQRPEKTLSSL
jgi:hypothetical protein